MRRIASLVIIAVVMTVIHASPASAQEGGGDPDCGEIRYACDGLNHYKHSIPQGVPYDAKFYHGVCGWCFVAEEPADPGECHPPCSEGFANAPEKMAAYQVALAAAAARDTRALLEVARTVPEYVGYNARRRAIQVVGCEGQIVASLPIRETSVAVAAERQLRTADALFVMHAFRAAVTAADAGLR